MNKIYPLDSDVFLDTIVPNGVDLFLIDPPYYGIVDDDWDNQWKDQQQYADWLLGLTAKALEKTSPMGSLIIFQALGRHGEHPIFKVVSGLEEQGWCFRNWITWKKRRAYGKSHDYLYCREEIIWMSKSRERTEVNFNIPLTDQLRGYKGFNKKYGAKSDFKRVSNVWDDIPELQRPQRRCQKPLPLLKRLIETHSNPGQLVVDFFAGYGSTCLAAVAAGRNTLGCEGLVLDAAAADQRLQAVVKQGEKLDIDLDVDDVRGLCGLGDDDGDDEVPGGIGE
jgi:DNA modification methylase